MVDRPADRGVARSRNGSSADGRPNGRLRMTLARRAQAAALISSLLVVLLSQSTIQGLYSDSGFQLKALQQGSPEESPSINVLTSPDPDDLVRDTRE